MVVRTFRIHPEPKKRLYFGVRIYRTHKLMLAALRRNDRWLGVRGNWAQSRAVCRSYTTLQRIRGRWRVTPRIGILFFYRRGLGVGVVAHEIAHAAVQWARRTRRSGRAVWGYPRGIRENDANEQFAHAVGEMNRQFWMGYRVRATRV